MMLEDQVFAQAALLAGELEDRQMALLRLLCDASAASLAARLREPLTAEDCRGDFIAAASLYALAALNEAGESGSVEEFRAGDLTVKQGSAGKNGASRCLRQQADGIMGPWLKSSFVFTGV